MSSVPSGRIAVRCSCGAKLAAPLAAAGRSIKCPKCHDSLPIPDTASAASESSVAPAPSGSHAPLPEAAVAARIPLRCSACGVRMTLPAAAAGKKGKCPKCGRAFVVPDPADTRLESPHPQQAPKPAPAPRTPDPFEPSEDAETNSLIDDLARQEQSAEGAAQAPIVEGPSRPCPSCGAMMPAGATLCVSCGYNTQTGRMEKTARTEPLAILRVFNVFGLLGGFGPFIRGCLLCGIGALLGAAIWSVVAIISGYEIGWIAWAVGGMAGFGMLLGSGGESTRGGVVAAGMSATAIVAAKVVIFFYIMYAVLTGNTNDVRLQRGHVVAVVTEEILDERGAVTEAQREAQWDSAAKEAERRVAKMNDQEIRRRAQESRDAQKELTELEAKVTQYRIAYHRADRAADQQGLAPWDKARGRLLEDEQNKCKALTEAEAAKAFKEVEEWDAGAKWNDARYCRDYLIYADLQQTLDDREAKAEKESSDEDEEDEEEYGKPLVPPAEWKTMYAAAAARIDAMPREQQMQRARETDAEEQQRIEKEMAEAGVDSEEADEEDGEVAWGALLSVFAMAMFRPLDIVFVLLAIGTAYRIAANGLTFGQSS